MKRFLSLLNILGHLTVLFGRIAILITGGYLLFLGLYICAIGVILYLLNFLVKRYSTGKGKYYIIQATLSVVYILFVCWVYLKWQEHNEIILPSNFKGEAGIIFGISGYPKLPETKFWKKMIELPSNGILITSSKDNEIPSNFRFKFKNGKEIGYNDLQFRYNDVYPCLANKRGIKYYSFTLGKKQTPALQDTLSEICDLINNDKLFSAYSLQDSMIVRYDSTSYLDLQGQNLATLPKVIATINVKELILTDNEFEKFPEQIFKMPNLEILYIGRNPINEIPQKIDRLQHLKTLFVNNTNITEINSNLSKLNELTDFDISGNNLKVLPDEIKDIPKLTWLSIDDNKFKDFSFVDQRLQKLQTLYLQNNEIKTFSAEVKYLTQLKELLIFDNQIDSIPNNISYLKNLEKLEIWDNPVKYISPEIKKLHKLSSMVIDGDNLSEQDKRNLKSWLPNCKIDYQTRKDKKL